MGPVDYLIVKFPGNQFSGEIAPELARLEQNKIIRIIDLAFVLKDQKGNVLITEAKNLGGVEGDAFSAFAAKASEWFSIDDIEAIATVLPNNSSAVYPVIRKHVGDPFEGRPPQFKGGDGRYGPYPPRNCQECRAEVDGTGRCIK